MKFKNVFSLYHSLLMMISMVTLNSCVLLKAQTGNIYETKPIVIKHSFSYGSDTNKHWQRTVNLPMTGFFVQEAHYVTTADSFPNQRLFANNEVENIEKHLKRSFEIYHKLDTTSSYLELYDNQWKKKWTPAENGKIGQGSVGKIQKEELSPALELWMMNMMWAKGQRPQRGTKFLMTHGDKRVIVIAGYETGPAAEKYLGGITCEVHAWLGTNDQSPIEIAYLINQNLPVGPIK